MDNNKEPFDRNKYITKWKKENVFRYEIQFNNDKDKELIEHLNKQSNRTRYIKELIRKDMH